MEKKNVSGLLIAAKVLMLISTIVYGFALFPLCWMLPMTISYYKKLNNGEKISVGFKVCTLIFVNIIAGILMFCDTSQMDKAPQNPPEVHQNKTTL